MKKEFQKKNKWKDILIPQTFHSQTILTTFHFLHPLTTSVHFTLAAVSGHFLCCVQPLLPPPHCEQLEEPLYFKPLETTTLQFWRNYKTNSHKERNVLTFLALGKIDTDTLNTSSTKHGMIPDVIFLTAFWIPGLFWWYYEKGRWSTQDPEHSLRHC